MTGRWSSLESFAP